MVRVDNHRYDELLKKKKDLEDNRPYDAIDSFSGKVLSFKPFLGNKDAIVVAIGMIIKPILLKK